MEKGWRRRRYSRGRQRWRSLGRASAEVAGFDGDHGSVSTNVSSDELNAMKRGQSRGFEVSSVGVG